jgi:hypothetical protein
LNLYKILNFVLLKKSKHLPAGGNGKIGFCNAVEPQREDHNEKMRNVMFMVGKSKKVPVPFSKNFTQIT